MKKLLSTQSVTVRLIIGILFAVFAAGVLFITGIFAGASLFDEDISNFVHLAGRIEGGNPQIIRYFLVLQSVSIFIVPALCIALMLRTPEKPFIDTEKLRNPVVYAIACGAIISSLPFINFLAEFNKLIIDVLIGPDNWMAVSEAKAKLTTEAILNTINIEYLYINIFTMAVMPAIAEELFFRGALQKLFLRKFKNEHTAIILTALLFSALHIQFYGFIPRMLMGIFMGYLYFWFRNLWVPIAVHFANNATAVLLYFFIFNEYLPEYVETIGSDTKTIGATMVSTAVVLFFLWLLTKKAGVGLFPNLRDEVDTQNNKGLE